MQRKPNAIVYGLPESNEQESIQAQVTQPFRKECFKHIDYPVQATILHSRNATKGDKSNPIDLRFKIERTKWNFVKIINAQPKEEGYFCKLDMSKEQRDQEYARQSKIHLSETNSDKEYRIRNMEIQVKNSSGEWAKTKPVTKESNF